MTIIRHEKTIIPQTLEGIKFANEYEQRLKEQWAFRGREECTQGITITAEFYFVVEGEGE